MIRSIALPPLFPPSIPQFFLSLGEHGERSFPPYIAENDAKEITMADLASLLFRVIEME